MQLVMLVAGPHATNSFTCLPALPFTHLYQSSPVHKSAVGAMQCMLVELDVNWSNSHDSRSSSNGRSSSSDVKARSTPSSDVCQVEE